jgi:hypothetical protein
MGTGKDTEELYARLGTPESFWRHGSLARALTAAQQHLAAEGDDLLDSPRGEL